MIQGSPEWFAERCGKVTASRVADIIATTKSGPSASRANYRAQLVAERLTGVAGESFTNTAMQWGIEQEPFARMEYEARKGDIVIEAGFVSHPTIKLSGASPDGLVGDDGLVEIKCPNTATHIDYILANKVPEKYKPQMTWQLVCTKRKWCDFVSYDPRMPDNLKLFVARFIPDSEYTNFLVADVRLFIVEVNELVNKLSSKGTESERAAMKKAWADMQIAAGLAI